MKILLLFFWVPVQLVAQKKAVADKAIEITITRLFDAIAARDENKIRACTTADFMLLENGLLWNNDSLAAKMKQLKSTCTVFRRINRIDFVRLEKHGNTAWIVFHNTAQITMDNKRRSVCWLESAVLLKVNRGWRVQLFHSTVLTDEIKPAE